MIVVDGQWTYRLNLEEMTLTVIAWPETAFSTYGVGKPTVHTFDQILDGYLDKVCGDDFIAWLPEL